MRRLSVTAVLFALALPAFSQGPEAWLRELDRTIDGKEAIRAGKLRRIEALKADLPGLEGRGRYDRADAIFREYAKFDLDSAMAYAKDKAEVARSLGLEEEYETSRLDLADIYITAGMYTEAEKLADEARIRSGIYYHVRHTLYSALALNSPFPGAKDGYTSLKEIYRDSLIAVLPPSDIGYVFALSEKLNEEGRYKEAVLLLEDKYSSLTTDEGKPILDYSLAIAWRGLHDRKAAMVHFARSAIGDLRAPVKEYKSLQELAWMLYEEGDLTRAYRYITCSMEDILSSNSQVRMAEFVPFLTDISSAYESKIRQRNSQLYTFIVVLAVLMLLFAGTVVYVFVQSRRLRKAYESLKKANAQLVDITGRLQEAGYIKERYLYMYMEEASGYMDRIEQYRRRLLMSVRKGGFEAVSAELSEPFDTDAEYRVFYNNFDQVFLQLFPTFVEEVNALLQTPLVPKPDRLLNTELRILALLRLGVTDSVKIAHFLRCSLSTVYNYRTRLRGSALSAREDFETAVSRIGTVNLE